MLVPLPPVGRETLRKPLDPFGKEKEAAVAALTDDLPDLLTPRIRLLDKEVRSEAKRKLRTRRILPVPFPVPFQRQRKRPRAPHLARSPFHPERRILPIHIAVTAPLAHLPAPMPRIPHQHLFILFDIYFVRLFPRKIGQKLFIYSSQVLTFDMKVQRHTELSCRQGDIHGTFLLTRLLNISFSPYY